MPPQQPCLVPVALAIAFAGIVIAASLYFVLKPAAPQTVGVGGKSVTVIPITDDDHILGDPNAPVKVIEYSDLDCQFCRSFNATMKQIMSTYGASGKVAWVYRQFPIVELHPNSAKLAEASECVAEIGGNTAFWKFIDGVFTSPTQNDRFDMTKLDAIAAAAGIPSAQFRTCYDSGKYQAKVAAQFDEATKAGGQGTPHNIIVADGVPPVPVPGAQPYSTIQSIIETMLQGR